MSAGLNFKNCILNFKDSYPTHLKMPSNKPRNNELVLLHKPKAYRDVLKSLGLRKA